MRDIKLSQFDRAFLTGCDHKTEWMLPWFVEGFRKHNPDVKMSLADFGMTDEMMEWAVASKEFHSIGQMDREMGQGWFLKPSAMLGTPYKEVCWIDNDFEIRGDMTEIFSYIEDQKLCMVEDKPWSKRTGEKWHNSGIVAFRGKPPILREWAQLCAEKPVRGDQETLHANMDSLRKAIYITDAPQKFNWMRLLFVDGAKLDKDIRGIHWTGQKGKEKIKELMAK